MATNDKCVTIVPYFSFKEDEIDTVKAKLDAFVEQAKSEKDCLYYGWTICGDKVHCREGYAHAEGALAHLDNVGAMLQDVLGSGMLVLTDLQVHGPEEELAKLRGPLADLNPSYWVLEHGFRN